MVVAATIALVSVSSQGWTIRVSDAPAWGRDLALEAAWLVPLAALLALVPTRHPVVRTLTLTLALAVHLLGASLFSLLDTPDARGVVVIAPLAALLLAWFLRIGRPGPAIAYTAFCWWAWSWAFWWLEGTPPSSLLLLSTAGLGAVGAVALWRPLPAVLLSLLLTRLPSTPPAPDRPERAAGSGPDVVLLVTDTLRDDRARTMQSHAWLSRAGHATTVQAASTWTLPSMATLMTGKPPHVHGAGRIPGTERERTGIHPSVPTVAEQFAAAGYHTVAVLDRNANVGGRLGFSRGFDVFDYDARASRRWALPSSHDHRARPIATQVGLTLAMDHAWLRPFLSWGERRDARTTLDRAREVLRQRGAHPLFLQVHLMDAHLPYRHDPELSTLTVQEAREWTDPSARDRVRAGYDAEVAQLDAALLPFLQALPPDAVVVWTSDHGEELWEHEGFEHGHAVWQEVIGVPLVTRGLPVPDGVLDHRWVASALLGLLDGTSPGPVHAARTAGTLYGDETLRAVRAGTHKLIAGEHGALAFDLAVDPGELHPLPNPDWDLHDALPPLPDQQEAGAWQPTDEERRQLEELGYVSP